MIRLRVSSARSWNASGFLMTLNAFIGRLRNNVCLCSIINVSITETKALLTTIPVSQTCIGTRETDDLRSQLMKRTMPSRRTRRSGTLGPCAESIRGPGGGPYDERPSVHLDRGRVAAKPHDRSRSVRSDRIRGLRKRVACGRSPLEPLGRCIARIRERRSPAAPPDTGDCLFLLNSTRVSSALSAPSAVRERGHPSRWPAARAPSTPARERTRRHRDRSDRRVRIRPPSRRFRTDGPRERCRGRHRLLLREPRSVDPPVTPAGAASTAPSEARSDIDLPGLHRPHRVVPQSEPVLAGHSGRPSGGPGGPRGLHPRGHRLLARPPPSARESY